WPRKERSSWLRGGKNTAVDRIEWITIADPATAHAALQRGEIDWLEAVLPDLLPALRKNPNITVGVTDPRGLVGFLAMNHLFPPFNDIGGPRAIPIAINRQ